VKRVLTAAVLIPLVIGLIFWGSNRSVRLAFAFLALLCLSEFLRLASRYGAQPMRLAAYLSGAWVVAAEPIVSIAGAYGPLPALLLDPGPAFFLFFALLLLVLAMLGGRELSASLPGAAATLLGVIYTSIPFRMAADLHALNPRWLFYVLIMNWIGDAAAYYAGRAVGRRRLAPRVSPGKTWEGAAASLVAAAPLGTLYLRRFLPAGPGLLPALLLSIVVNMAAQVGDLAESALKRGANVKDSGSLLPGHGGVLDRLDGLLFSVPVVWLAAGR
jgi:phosphatidate cytidylyltransferase